MPGLFVVLGFLLAFIAVVSLVSLVVMLAI